VWFETESKLDAVTAVSGSGPAYVFYMVEALAVAACDRARSVQAMQLARQTVIGAAALMEPIRNRYRSSGKTSPRPRARRRPRWRLLMAPDGLERCSNRAVLAARVRSEELGRSSG